MNQQRRLNRFKTATGHYDHIRAMHIAQHMASGKSVDKVTINGTPVRTERKNPKTRRVSTIIAQ